MSAFQKFVEKYIRSSFFMQKFSEIHPFFLTNEKFHNIHSP